MPSLLKAGLNINIEQVIEQCLLQTLWAQGINDSADRSSDTLDIILTSFFLSHVSVHSLRLIMEA